MLRKKIKDCEVLEVKVETVYYYSMSTIEMCYPCFVASKQTIDLRLFWQKLDYAI